METQRHGLQMQLLVRPLSQWLKTQGREAFVGGNTAILILRFHDIETLTARGVYNS